MISFHYSNWKDLLKDAFFGLICFIFVMLGIGICFGIFLFIGGLIYPGFAHAPMKNPLPDCIIIIAVGIFGIYFGIFLNIFVMHFFVSRKYLEGLCGIPDWSICLPIFNLVYGKTKEK